jgi:hypothetical protein
MPKPLAATLGLLEVVLLLSMTASAQLSMTASHRPLPPTRTTVNDWRADGAQPRSSSPCDGYHKNQLFSNCDEQV